MISEVEEKIFKNGLMGYSVYVILGGGGNVI